MQCVHLLRIYGLALACMIVCSTTVQAVPDVVVYHRPNSDLDTRYDYHIALLKLALERTAEEYGPAATKPSKLRMTQQRLMFSLEEGHSDIDVAISPTGTWRETQLEPIRIPLDKGLLGWRLLLVRAEDLPRFAKVRDIWDFKMVTVGQGAQWPDVEVYKAAGFRVVTGNVYEGLFAMLDQERFDCFPRGVEEAFTELETRKDKYPNLRVEPTIVIHYPFARYFWVAKSSRGDRLRERITKGLETMIADGSFDKLFYKFKGPALEKARLGERKVFRIKNPFMPKGFLYDRPELWYEPLGASGSRLSVKNQ